MALPNLSGSNIQDTFHRVLHTDGTEYFDGTGSVVPIVLANTSPSFASITASYDISASRWIRGQQLNISSAATFGSAKVLGNLSINGDLSHTPSGHIRLVSPLTASADISSSANVYASNYFDNGTNISSIYQPALTFGIADTNVLRASASVVDNDFLRVNGTAIEGVSAGELGVVVIDTIGDGDLTIAMVDELQTFHSDTQTALSGKAPINNPSFTGDITASGNISASGNMTATSMSVDTIFGYNQHGEYTNNIRTGNLIAATNNTYHIGDYQNYYANIFSTQISTNGITTIGSGTEIELAAGVLIPNVDKGPDLGTAAKRYGEVHSEQTITTHITASGNISASGDLFFNNIDGGTF